MKFINSFSDKELANIDLSQAFSKKDIDIFLRKGVRAAVINKVAPVFLNLYYGDKNYLAKLKKMLNLQSGETEISFAFHKAARYGDAELMKILLNKNKFSNIDAEDEYGNTPLICATREGYIDILQLLVENGASLDLETSNNDILSKAIVNKQDQALEYLLENSKNFKAKDIFLAVAYKDGKFIKNIKAFKEFSAEKIKKIHDAARAYFYLGLSYSVSDFGLPTYIANLFINNEIKSLTVDFKYRDKLLEASEIALEKGEFIDQSGQKNKVIVSAVKDHQSYFIVKYDKIGKPCEISYCDANLPIDKKKA